MLEIASMCVSLENENERATVIIIIINKTNDLILNLTPENMTQHSRIE